MIDFAWPYLFFLIPLPWIVYRLFPEAQFGRNSPLKVPGMEDFSSFQAFSNPMNKFNMLCYFFIWMAFLSAAARPQWIGDVVEIPQSGRDLMMAVDLSGSMQMEDFILNGRQTDRLTALKSIAGEFIEKRKGDRVGLILFGSNAYLQSPLTFDLQTVKQLLSEATVGLAGNETAIGDAIGLAIKQLRDSPQESRVLILLTDGNNNVGELSTEKAADIAARSNLKIHTVAIGAKEVLVQTFFGARTMNPSADMDEKSLQLIAEKTGGKFFRAYNTQELSQIYKEIDQLESIERSSQYYRPTDEIYFWPLLIAIIGCVLMKSLSSLKRRLS
jgi:Ca-activated chloride channel family protein